MREVAETQTHRAVEVATQEEGIMFNQPTDERVREWAGRMSDLSPKEREALEEVCLNYGLDISETGAARFILAALAAVPRLREIPGMGLDSGNSWHLRTPEGHLSPCEQGRWEAVISAKTYNDHGPGHHAVRLAVVEVATPTAEQDDGE